MRGNLVILDHEAFNKQSSGLIVKCLEIPHSAYSNRCMAFILYPRKTLISEANDKRERCYKTMNYGFEILPLVRIKKETQ